MEEFGLGLWETRINAKIDRQITHAGAVHSKPHQSHSDEVGRLLFVAKALYLFENGREDEWEEDEVYVDLARVAIDAMRDYYKNVVSNSADASKED